MDEMMAGTRGIDKWDEIEKIEIRDAIYDGN